MSKDERRRRKNQNAHLQLNDAELSFFWKLWLLFVFVAPDVIGAPDELFDTDGALYVVKPWAVGGQ